MTIFGFNTDVKHGDVVYHVQTEARPRDLLLQTLVFVKGQCVSKHATSYAHKTVEPGFSEEAIHELLKAQHRHAIETIQQGNLAALAGSGQVQDVGGNGLSLNWTVSAVGPEIMISVQVLDTGVQAEGAEVEVFPVNDVATQLLAAQTGSEGRVGLALRTELLHDAAILVRATLGTKSVTRKVRLPLSS